MQQRPEFTEEELELIVDLLQHERFELPSEIHHTNDVDMRQGLRRRQEMVDSLLARLAVRPKASAS